MPIPKPRNILPFRHNRPLQVMVLWLLVLWIITAIEPFNRRDWLLENLLVFVYSGLLVFSYPRFAFSNLSYALFTVFLSLHLIGAHYTYAETPFGFWLQDLFDFRRNHYDRLVHFSFGLLIAYPFRELLLRAAGVRPGWSYILAIIVVLAFSGFYEMLEGIVAVTVSPELGAAYLGTQGDVWDAHKDMALASLGALLAMLITAASAGFRSTRGSFRRERIQGSRKVRPFCVPAGMVSTTPPVMVGTRTSPPSTIVYRSTGTVVWRSESLRSKRGSGKTRTLVGRYLALLDAGMSLRSIAAITFTEKAAREMRAAKKLKAYPAPAEVTSNEWCAL